jgi:hypothetical protein
MSLIGGVIFAASACADANDLDAENTASVQEGVILYFDEAADGTDETPTSGNTYYVKGTWGLDVYCNDDSVLVGVEFSTAVIVCRRESDVSSGGVYAAMPNANNLSDCGVGNLAVGYNANTNKLLCKGHNSFNTGTTMTSSLFTPGPFGYNQNLTYCASDRALRSVDRLPAPTGMTCTK